MKSLQQLVNEKLKVSKAKISSNKTIKVADDKELQAIIKKRYQENKTYIDLSDVDVSNVKKFDSLFTHLDVERINLSGWNTSNSETFYSMFAHCGNLKTIEGLENFDLSKANEVSAMFSNCFALEGLEDQLEDWNVSNVKRFKYMFFSCNAIEDFSFVKNWDMSNAKTIEAMFANSKIDSTEYVNSWDVSNLIDCSHLFSKCKNIKNADLTGWKNTSNILNAVAVFKDCENLVSLNLSNMKIELRNINFICCDCERLVKVDMTGLDMSKLAAMNYAFRNCEELKEIGGLESWNLEKLINAEHTFEGCSSLVADLSSWKLNHYIHNTKMFFKASRKIKKPKLNI